MLVFGYAFLLLKFYLFLLSYVCKIKTLIRFFDSAIHFYEKCLENRLIEDDFRFLANVW